MSTKVNVERPSDNLAHAMAGAGGGLLSMALTFVQRTSKIRFESSRAHSDFLDAVRGIVRREGVSGLYSGLTSALFGISVTNFVYYYWYELTRSSFEVAALRSGRHPKRLTTVESMVAGAIAGSTTVLLTNPIWVVNTRMTIRKQNNASTKDLVITQSPSTLGTLVDLIKNDGPLALFAGVAPALILVINPILQYTIFEQLRNMLQQKRRMTPTIAFLLGALGKLFATTITYPYITLKSRMHVAGRDGDRSSMVDTIRRILREEGYLGFYKGVGPKVAQSVITAAFLFGFKDILYKQTIKLRRQIQLPAA
ncbi:BgTH12-01191 [Blumeria graminis f. sp. triticale]|uniref:Bgt-2613 n=3 Tax=Blumeria graminis TaxID=34373 RepID=A0A061HM37_BLUGR|nr:Peroxisomal adenine nucleotide transporter [Blumeria graminis f. sp. tritici 96224]CAD6505701.1 BgTH12-01191 [Blumeria graminis f. sp. triticale]VDB93862.1 Bgt-2613 [Blumeria graminis f. sp. tritici]